MTAPSPRSAASPAWLRDPLAWREAGSFLSWEGHRLFFRSAGHGAALVLLHGFPTSSWDFKDIFEELTASYRVLALDYLGFGFSDKPRPASYSVRSYADQIEALLAHEGITEYHVLAHDLGDTVAQELLARAVEKERVVEHEAPRLRSVFLLNGGLFPELHRPRLAQSALDSPLGFVVARLLNQRLFDKSMREVFGPHTQPSRADLDGFWTCVSEQRGQHIYHRLIRYMRERRAHRERWVGALLHAPVPIAACIGLLDPVSGVHVADHLAHAAPHIAVTRLDDVGHYPQTEAPTAVLDAYRHFRASVTP